MPGVPADLYNSTTSQKGNIQLKMGFQVRLEIGGGALADMSPTATTRKKAPDNAQSFLLYADRRNSQASVATVGEITVCLFVSLFL